MKTTISRSAVMIIAAIMFLAFSGVASAQQAGTDRKENREARKEKIQAQKVAFITNELQLTTQEAEKFWPVYNEFRSKLQTINKAKKDAEKTATKDGIDQLTDKQAEDLINSQIKSEQQALDLKKDYAQKFIAVIGAKKTVQLYRAEKKFNAELLKMLKDANKDENDD